MKKGGGLVSSIQVGARLKSTVCTTEIIVVQVGADADVELGCGGSPMVPIDSTVGITGAPVDGLDEGSALGKRYIDEEVGLELLCTKGGAGSLVVNARPLVLKGSKPLPSSD